MKLNRFPQCLAAAAILLTAHADEPLRTIEVQGRYIYATREQMKTAFDAAKLPEVPAAPISSGQFETVRGKLRELGAEFFSHPQALTVSGQKAVIDAVREFRYPTQFDTDRKSGKAFPTAFETRNIGVTLEFTGTVAPDGLIDLTLDSEVTNFLGFIDYLAQKPARPGDTPALEELLKAPLTAGGAWQPIFTSFTIRTKVRLRSGDTVFFGGPMKIEAVKPPKDGGGAPSSTQPEQQVFVFITAKTTTQD